MARRSGRGFTVIQVEVLSVLGRPSRSSFYVTGDDLT